MCKEGCLALRESGRAWARSAPPPIGKLLQYLARCFEGDPMAWTQAPFATWQLACFADQCWPFVAFGALNYTLWYLADVLEVCKSK